MESEKTYNKMYYDKNKEELRKKAGEKCVCEVCGKLVRKDFLNKHKKTAICMKTQIPANERLVMQINKLKKSIKLLEDQIQN